MFHLHFLFLSAKRQKDIYISINSHALDADSVFLHILARPENVSNYNTNINSQKDGFIN
jgi:hypothetical protein